MSLFQELNSPESPDATLDHLTFPAASFRLEVPQDQENQSLKSLHEKVDKLTKDVAKLTIMMEHHLKSQKKQTTFPIQSHEDLERIDFEIGENSEHYRTAISRILSGTGIHKALPKIISEKLAIHYNYDGQKGKKAFKQFRHLNTLIFECCQREGYEEKQHTDNLRKAFRLIKGRHHKQTARAKEITKAK